jgi:hypothetical protein
LLVLWFAWRQGGFVFTTPPRAVVEWQEPDWQEPKLPSNRPRYRFPVKQALLSAL